MKIHGIWTFVLLFTLSIQLVFSQDIEDQDLEEIEDMAKTERSMGKSKSPPNQSKTISLRDIIEEGLRQNSFELVRQFSKEKVEINWKDAYSDFWYPQLSFQLKTNESLIDNVYGDVNDNAGTTIIAQKADATRDKNTSNFQTHFMCILA